MPVLDEKGVTQFSVLQRAKGWQKQGGKEYHNLKGGKRERDMNIRITPRATKQEKFGLGEGGLGREEKSQYR